MIAPRATYRLQFRNGMDFATAAGIAPYLAKLGVSHLYASPLFQATPGSTHGYDVTDHSQFDQSLGGYDGFRRLSAALDAHGLGLILDIVPNHMAASCHNPWWADVLRYGRHSSYAGHFDIDWSRPKLLLPILGQPFGAALAAGDFSLGHDAEGPVWRASGQSLPLDPGTWPLIFHDFADAGPGIAVEPRAFRVWRDTADNRARLDAHLAAVSRDAGRMLQIHEAQNWRLAYWRAARDMLGYRRFFEISDLVGVRVEEPAVFDDVHRFVFELVDDGRIHGLRVDHVDGLADPAGYLDRLAGNLPRPVPVWVEKILDGDERLPTTWPIAGATGYEFLAQTSAVLTNAGAGSELDRAYQPFGGTGSDYQAMRSAAKRDVLTRNLAAELDALVGLARQAFESEPTRRDWGPDTLRRAIIALLIAMPVYRTYFGPTGGTTSDEAILGRVVEAARSDAGLDEPAVVDDVAACINTPNNPAAHAFCVRFQQVSGALMAKAVEDTLFYRFNRLISSNEVGADPEHFSVSTTAFHAFAADRAESHPIALNATATHDTKRGEDARMRIAAISEAPQHWAAAVAAFEEILAADRELPEIDANTRWLFYQALLGSWVPGLVDDLADRIAAFVLKAARESKVHTSWVKTDSDYEARLERFVAGALSSAGFVDFFAEQATEFVEIGARKSLAQLALKLTVPGIPDIYQGTEVADLSLVDPDNRRPVDFGRLSRLIERGEGEGAADFDPRKASLLRFGLDLRTGFPDIFAGNYRPLPTGERGLAYAREGASDLLVVAVDLSGGQVMTTAGAEIQSLVSEGSLRPGRSFPEIPAGSASVADAMARHLRDVGVSLVLLETEA